MPPLSTTTTAYVCSGVHFGKCVPRLSASVNDRSLLTMSTIPNCLRLVGERGLLKTIGYSDL